MENSKSKSNVGLWVATIIVLILVVLVAAVGISDLVGSRIGGAETRQVMISTEKGDITMEIYPKKMPITCENFIKCVEDGVYEGSNFHRVEDWLIQGGETDKELEPIKLETNDELTHDQYMVGMARTSEEDSATSQFYILKQEMHSIDGQYAIFGKVIDGTDVVDSFKAGDKITGAKMLD